MFINTLHQLAHKPRFACGSPSHLWISAARQSRSIAVHPSSLSLFWALAAAYSQLPALPFIYDNLADWSWANFVVIRYFLTKVLQSDLSQFWTTMCSVSRCTKQTHSSLNFNVNSPNLLHVCGYKLSITGSEKGLALVKILLRTLEVTFLTHPLYSASYSTKINTHGATYASLHHTSN